MDQYDKLDHLKNGFMVDHNTDTLDVKVPSIGWKLLLVQSGIRIYLKKIREYQQF